MNECPSCGSKYEANLAVCPNCAKNVEIDPEIKKHEKVIREALENCEGQLD